MTRTSKYLDGTTWIVVFITLGLFITAVFVKGLGHDLLLEAGVFLVSVKLILMNYKSSVAGEELRERLDELRAVLGRIDAGLSAGTEHGHVEPAATPRIAPETEGLPAEIRADARR